MINLPIHNKTYLILFKVSNIHIMESKKIWVLNIFEERMELLCDVDPDYYCNLHSHTFVFDTSDKAEVLIKI
jgi:hypothetical protein